MVGAVAILDDLKAHPCCYLDGDDAVWPVGPFESDTPPELELARHISVVLRAYCDTRQLSTYAAAAEAGMSQGALYNVLHGRAWPNSSVIARLERSLGLMLWPTGHGTNLRLCPRDHLASGTWPYGGLTPGFPPEAEIAQTISERFHSAFSRFESVTDAAAQLDVSEGVVEALLYGSAWIDWATLARIERHLNVRIWVPQQR